MGIERKKVQFKFLFAASMILMFIFLKSEDYVKAASNDASYELNYDSLEMETGENVQLDIINETEGQTYKIVWESDDKKVATVTKDGRVTAKKEGDVTITAIVDDKYELYCDISVYRKEATYTEIVKAAKAYKSKNILFDNIDIGYHSKLYCDKVFALFDDYSKTHYYFFRVSYMPYINMIKKTDGTCKIELNFSGLFREYSIYDHDYDLDQIMFYTKNRRIKFDLDTEESKKNKKNVYIKDLKYKTNLSNNKNVDEEKLDKLITIFEQKDVMVRITLDNGSYASGIMSESYRSKCLKLFKIYKKLIEM